MIRVHLKGSYSSTERELLEELAGEGFSISSGEITAGSDCEVLVAGPLTSREISLCGSLRAVVVPYAGVPSSTLEAIREHPGIRLYNLHHNAVSASEMAVALMLCASKLIIPADRALREGDWSPRYRPDGLLLEDSRVLVLGWGAIGQRVGRICSSMGASVKGVKRTFEEGLYTPAHLPSLLLETDILVVCVPLTDSTRGMIGEQELSRLPRGAVLVNVSRGSVVHEEALYRSLIGGHLGAAGIDVWYSYPGTEESRKHTQPSKYDFGALDNVVMSPHRGGSFGLEGIEKRRFRDIALFLRSFSSDGLPGGCVKVEEGY